MSYACYNRKPFVDELVQYAISSSTGELVKVVIPNTMSKECHYQKDDLYADPGCVGCIHKEK